MAASAIYGARDPGRQWYFYAQKFFAEHGPVECRLERGLYYVCDEGGLAAVVHSHVLSLIHISEPTRPEPI
eukprot:5681356-Pyramimonas_sp.AAC.1